MTLKAMSRWLRQLVCFHDPIEFQTQIEPDPMFACKTIGCRRCGKVLQRWFPA